MSSDRPHCVLKCWIKFCNSSDFVQLGWLQQAWWSTMEDGIRYIFQISLTCQWWGMICNRTSYRWVSARNLERCNSNALAMELHLSCTNPSIFSTQVSSKLFYVAIILQINGYLKYRQISNIRHTKSKNWNVCRLILQLSLPYPLKPGVKSRMKM